MKRIILTIVALLTISVGIINSQVVLQPPTKFPKVIFQGVTSTATTGTVIETLATATITANTLAKDGDCLRITYYADTTVANTTKTMTLVFGSTNIGVLNATGTAGLGGNITAHVCRLTATTQVAESFGTANGGNGSTNLDSAPTETLTGDVTVLFRGTTASALGELIYKIGQIVYEPAP